MKSDVDYMFEQLTKETDPVKRKRKIKQIWMLLDAIVIYRCVRTPS